MSISNISEQLIKNIDKILKNNNSLKIFNSHYLQNNNYSNKINSYLQNLFNILSCSKRESDNYFESNNILSYVGFRKHHPHDEHSVLRLGFKKPISNTSVIKEYIKNMNSIGIETYKQIQQLIHSN